MRKRQKEEGGCERSKEGEGGVRCGDNGSWEQETRIKVQRNWETGGAGREAWG